MAASATSNHLALTLADSPPLPTTLETNNFFSSLKIITQSSILYFYFYICVKKRFSVLWKKNTLSHFFTHSLWKIISTFHQVGTHILIVPYVVNGMSYRLSHSTVMPAKVYASETTSSVILLFVNIKQFHFFLLSSSKHQAIIYHNSGLYLTNIRFKKKAFSAY